MKINDVLLVLVFFSLGLNIVIPIFTKEAVAWNDVPFNNPEYDMIYDSCIDSYLLGTQKTQTGQFLRLNNSEYYVSCAQGSGGRGSLYTYRVWNDNGTIQKKVIDYYNYSSGSSDCYAPTISWIPGTDKYVVFYSYYWTGYDSWVKTFKIQDNGDITNSIIDSQELTNDTVDVTTIHTSILNVTGNVFSFAFAAQTTSDGVLTTLWIDKTGIINNTIVDRVYFDTGYILYTSNLNQIKIDSNTIAVVYSDTNNDLTIKTYNISSSGDITDPPASSWTPAAGTFYGDFIVHVYGDIYNIVYDELSTIYSKSLKIHTNGTIIKSWIDTTTVDSGGSFTDSLDVITIREPTITKEGKIGISYNIGAGNHRNYFAILNISYTGSMPSSYADRIKLSETFVGIESFRSGEVISVNDSYYVSQYGFLYSNSGSCLKTFYIDNDERKTYFHVTLRNDSYLNNIMNGSVSRFEKYTIYDNSVSVYSSNWYAQTFTVGNTGSNVPFQLYKIMFRMNRVLFPGNSTIGIRNVSPSTGKPTGSDLVNCTFDSSTFISSDGYYNISFPSLTLEPGRNYSIVFRSPAATSSWRVSVYYKLASSYTGGSYFSSTNSGSTWTEASGRDFAFEIYGYTGNFFNGTLTNNSNWNSLTWLGSLTNNTSWVLDDEWTGTADNTTSWRPINWSSSLTNYTSWVQESTWTGTLYNGTVPACISYYIQGSNVFVHSCNLAEAYKWEASQNGGNESTGWITTDEGQDHIFNFPNAGNIRIRLTTRYNTTENSTELIIEDFYSHKDLYPPSHYTTRGDCEDCGYYWYNGTCSNNSYEYWQKKNASQLPDAGGYPDWTIRVGEWNIPILYLIIAFVGVAILLSSEGKRRNKHGK
jgi:hypothetical protein